MKERLEALIAYRKKSKAASLAALTVTLLLTMFGTALGVFAPEESLRVILAEDQMLLEGKNIFAYTSGELYTLWTSDALEIPEGASIGYDGYEGETPSQGPLGLHFPIDAAFDVTTFASEVDISHGREALLSLPLAETNYPVSAVRLTDAGVYGPFGIEVGMCVPTLLSLLPEATETLLPSGGEFDAVYAARYQDANGTTFTIEAYSLMDMVSFCTITRN